MFLGGTSPPPGRSPAGTGEGVESRCRTSCRAGDDRTIGVEAEHQLSGSSPVKRLARAKTRLGIWPRPPGRAGLAFAADTVVPPCTARSSTESSWLPTTRSVRTARALGAQVVADKPDAGLNPALVHGAVEAKRSCIRLRCRGTVRGPAGAAPGELERALRPSAIDAASFVADVAGVGTTLLVARPLDELHPRFGARSRAAASGRGSTGDRSGALRRCAATWTPLVDLWDAESTGPGVTNP